MFWMTALISKRCISKRFIFSQRLCLVEKEYSQCLCLFSITEQNHLLFTDCLRFVEFMVVFFVIVLFICNTFFHRWFLPPFSCLHYLMPGAWCCAVQSSASDIFVNRLLWDLLSPYIPLTISPVLWLSRDMPNTSLTARCVYSSSFEVRVYERERVAGF